jgi:uncharacterized membrane protein
MADSTAKRQRIDSRLPAYRMAFLLISSGLGHFASPGRFDAAIPAELPGDARTYTHVSGVLEVAIGALLLPRSTRHLGALSAAGFFILIAPAIVNGVRLAAGKGVLPMLVAIARLPLHVAMVSQAVKIARNA